MCLLFVGVLRAQTPTAPTAYTSWVAGDTADAVTKPLGGVVLAGGSTDQDEAMQWFLRRAAGGDVVILRASGSNGYNDYLFQKLGVAVNSVETILVNSRALAFHPDIVRKIRQAEGVFLAGGDQGKYVRFWRDTPLSDALNARIADGIVVGGTSAGCAVLSRPYFAAREGTILSAEALANPYDARVDVATEPFIREPLTQNLITDMHYNRDDRSGRHVVFLARIATDTGQLPRGIGIDEKTAVCISPDGAVRVFGKGNAYFLQPTAKPERCEKNQPLTWNRNGRAIRVWTVPGTAAGTLGFDVTRFAPAHSAVAYTFWWVHAGTLRKP